MFWRSHNKQQLIFRAGIFFEKNPISHRSSRKEKRPIFRRSSAGSLRDPRTCPNAGKWAFLTLALQTGIEPSEITPKSPVSKGSFLGVLNFVLNFNWMT